MATIVTETRPAFSWGAAIAGTFAAMAVSLLLLSLGAGIGLKFAPPYSLSASVTALGIGAAVWIILAQMWGYAVGGYIAGRLSSRWSESEPESNFLDGAHGFIVWALGVFLTGVLVAIVGLFAAGSAASLGASALAARSAVPSNAPTSYLVDSLFRMDRPPSVPSAPPATAPVATPSTAPAASPPGPLTTAPAPTPPAGPAAQLTTPQGELPPTMMAIAPQSPASSDLRAEVGRIFTSGVGDGRLSNADRNYLSRLVSERTGIASEVASARVLDAERRALAATKEAADTAAKAGAFASFWTFMALLLGAVSATLGGVFGGNQRDEWALDRTHDSKPASRPRRATT